MTIVRVLRVLEYIGPREWVETTLERGAVPCNGEHVILPGGQKIRSAIVGTFPEIFEEAKDAKKEGLGK